MNRACSLPVGVWNGVKLFAGLRVGGVYTYNAEVLQAYDDISHFCTPSSLAQTQLLGLFDDETFIDNYIADNAASLQANAEIVTSGLDNIGVPYVPPQVCSAPTRSKHEQNRELNGALISTLCTVQLLECACRADGKQALIREMRMQYTSSSVTVVPFVQGGFFVWMCLKDVLQIDTFEREAELWKGIFDKAKIAMVPGETCRAKEPGWYRVCFCAHPAEAMHDFVARLKHFIDQYKGKSEKQNWSTQNFMLPIGFGSRKM